MESVYITDIISEKGQIRFEIISDEEFDVFSILNDVNIDIVVKQGNRIFISTRLENLDITSNLFQNNAVKFDVLTGLSKISIIGIGIKTNVNVLYKIIALLNENNIKVFTISTSEVKISLLIEDEFLQNAVGLLKNFCK